MIWESQYDAMMSWMEITDTSSVPGYNKSKNPGIEPLDVTKNVYDLYGSYWEWTMRYSRSTDAFFTDGITLMTGNCTENREVRTAPLAT